jgi:hypothetical protein
MSLLRPISRTAMRWTVWARILIVAEIALTLKRHLDLLEPGERRDLRRLVRKSKGRPSNLSERERRRLGAIVSKLEPRGLARETAAAAAPWRRPTPKP